MRKTIKMAEGFPTMILNLSIKKSLRVANSVDRNISNAMRNNRQKRGNRCEKSLYLLFLLSCSHVRSKEKDAAEKPRLS